MCSQEQAWDILSQVSDMARTVFPNVHSEAILYGSYARGDYDSESDMDIMVLADVPRTELNRYKAPFLMLSSELGLTYDLLITITLKDQETFDRYLNAVPFYQAVRKEGISSSLTIDSLIEIRQGSDYDDFYVISKEDVAGQLKRAEEFVTTVEAYLLQRYGGEGSGNPPLVDKNTVASPQ